ncbi:hypothetical protein HAX54_025801, partial [Datura stramonium]|nr:hypothetical protein [Datura stramonium]
MGARGDLRFYGRRRPEIEGREEEGGCMELSVGVVTAVAGSEERRERRPVGFGVHRQTLPETTGKRMTKR